VPVNVIDISAEMLERAGTAAHALGAYDGAYEW
jgi:hypothetical protein